MIFYKIFIIANFFFHFIQLQAQLKQVIKIPIDDY